MDPRDRAQEHRRQDYARQDYQRMDAARTARLFEARRDRENAVFGPPRRAGRPAQTDTAAPEGREQGGGLWGFLADAAMIAGGVYLDVIEERWPVEQAASVAIVARCSPADGEAVDVTRVWEYERRTNDTWQLKTLPTPFLDSST
jgi:hypothetical protein